MSRANELESHMILRVPDHMAEKLHQYFDEEESESSNEKFIEVTPIIFKNSEGEDVSQFKIDLQGEVTKATLLDLPCVIESHKTIDDINFFKVGNISQMVFVHPNREDMIEQGSFNSPQLYPDCSKVRGRLLRGNQKSQVSRNQRSDSADQRHL